MPEPVVHLERVSFRRKARGILHDISWQINKQSHWALLGANGSGKTTLLKIITGYEWPTSGDVYVLGRHLGGCCLHKLRRMIGWASCAVNVRLPPRDTALEIVVSGLAASIGLYREFTDEELSAGRKALAMLAAEELAGEPFGLLSQGQQQRVLIARALVSEPDLLILDEPCIGLDPAARQRLLDDLDRLAGASDCPNIIYVTHHIEEIGPWITDVILLKDGRIVAKGKPREIITDELMGKVFDAVCHVARDGDRFDMRIDSQGGA